MAFPCRESFSPSTKRGVVPEGWVVTHFLCMSYSLQRAFSACELLSTAFLTQKLLSFISLMLNSSPAPQARPAIETQAGAISRNPRLPTHLQYDRTRVLQNACATRRNGNRNHLFDFFLAFPPGSGNIVPVENGLVAREVLWPLHAPDLFTMRFHVCGACSAHYIYQQRYRTYYPTSSIGGPSVYRKCRPTFQLLVVFTLSIVAAASDFR